MENIVVILMDLPYDVDGFCRLNEDGSYTIVINSRNTHEAQKETYEHEMIHIRRGDHYKSDVQTIEYDSRQFQTILDNKKGQGN